ncbi:hypothetical protein FB451DRAFT_1194756 [Mycena latifolia]|nr:hypothetical protein FB451DRAFT_1194756 [Mycena latifolia]
MFFQTDSGVTVYFLSSLKLSLSVIKRVSPDASETLLLIFEKKFWPDGRTNQPTPGPPFTDRHPLVRLLWLPRIFTGRETALLLLLSCGAPKCQKYDWVDGNLHKDRCHLFEVDRKLSDEITSIESLGPRINDLTVSIEEKLSLWKGRHRKNFGMIQAAVFQNRNMLEDTLDLGIFIKLVGQGPNYDHCSFVIEKVALIPWTPRQGWARLMTGFCLLPGGEIPPPYASEEHYQYSGTALPPCFDLHRYITHVNRGITHFHGSFWPLPCRLSDSAFEAAEPPPEWLRYMLCNSAGFRYWRRHPECNTEVIMVFAVIKRDGTTLLYKYDNDISASCSDRPAAIAKVDPTEFKKLLDDPSRKLCMIPAYKCL